MTAEAVREPEGVGLDRARRNALILSVGQAVVGSAAPICISLGALTGTFLLAEDKSLATAPVSGYNIGVALGAIPAAILMRHVGRRLGFVCGALVTGLGGAMAASAIFASSFWLFGLSLLVVGLGGSFVQQYRFAAADGAPAAFKPRAISWVLGGGVFAAIIGPQAVILTRDAFSPVPFAGAFVAIVALSLVGIVALSFLKPTSPPAKAVRSGTVAKAHMPVEGRSVLAIASQPRFAIGLLCAVGSYALMSFVMTGAPLAMVGCGFSPDEATLGISWHVMAMFAPSFVTGRLIVRFGAEAIVATGLSILIACALVALSGIALWQFWTALILLGLGWNFGFIGATSMVAETYAEEEKNRIQGLHDFVLFGTVAFASLMSGHVYNSAGWEAIVTAVIPIALICLVGLGAMRLLHRPPAATR